MNASDIEIKTLIEQLYRDESRRVFATLIRLLGDFDRAEEAMHEAFASAVVQWTRDGVPANPRAWLVSAGRFQAINALRRRARFDASLSRIAERLEQTAQSTAQQAALDVEDDRLRLIYTCCHPAIAPEAQIALTLREVCGLTTEAIASAFFMAPTTLAQRIVRGKSKIRDAGIPFRVPEAEDLPERRDAVLRVIYLVFNEGYSPSSGDSLVRPDLSAEAIRLGRLLYELFPDPEVGALLALMLLQESRRTARCDESGDLILLEDQDRSLWDRPMIDEGVALVEQSLRTRGYGTYALQAAIAAVHAESPSAAETDWRQIVALYDLLLQMEPTPIIELNRAVAVAMRDGPAAGLAIIDRLLERGDLKEYHLTHAARADLYRRMGRARQAVDSYQAALSLVRQDAERRFLERRITELTAKHPFKFSV